MQAPNDKYHAKSPDSGIHVPVRQVKISSYKTQHAAKPPALRVNKTGLKNERPVGTLS